MWRDYIIGTAFYRGTRGRGGAGCLLLFGLSFGGSLLMSLASQALDGSTEAIVVLGGAIAIGVAVLVLRDGSRATRTSIVRAKQGDEPSVDSEPCPPNDGQVGEAREPHVPSR
jgi:pimeloyl-ACP methyl ester carboxylesterase